MAIPILGKRRERKEAELQAAIDAGVEKAMSPVMSQATQMMQGFTTYNPSDPFGQASNYGGAAYNALPRPWSEFGSLFGPGSPLVPEPLDALGVSGRVGARRNQYEVATNLQLGRFGPPWAVLRQISEEVDVVARCIQLVQDAIGGMEWSWGFSRSIINRIRIENDEPNSARATALAREKYGDELAIVQKFWDRPDEKMGYTFNQWLNLAIWANLVYDGIVCAPEYLLNGELHSISLIDTGHIKILLDNRGFLPQPPAPAYQQILYGFPRSEFQAEDIDRATGKTPAAYRADQLSYYVQRPRLHTPYGFSTVEECINYATLYKQRQEWMHAEWTHGSTPKGVIKTTDTEGWTPEQFAYFQQITNDQWSGQTQRRQQVMVLRPGMEWIQLKDMAELYNNNFDEWCVMQIGAKFGVPQQQLGIPMRSYMHSGAQNQTSMDLADKFAIDALVNHLINSINDLTRRYMGVGPEITITATSGNGDESDYQRAQADASDVNNGIRTRNEVRAERGLPLISDPEADVLAATAGNAVIFFPGQLAYQEATEQAVLNGTLQSATPNSSTPNDRQENAPAALQSQSNTAETTNRAVGHVATGKDIVTPGTDRKARAAGRQPSAPQPSGDHGSYSEKGLENGSDVEQRDTGTLGGEGGETGGDPDEVRKELAAFTKYVKARMGKSSYRDFSFRYQGPVRTRQLNDAARTGNIDIVKAAIDADNVSVIAAGICVRAADSGRVLLIQRALDDTDPDGGTWEWPGGHSEGDETPAEAAVREWQEETGIDLPDGEMIASWVCPIGTYQTFLWEVPSEWHVQLNVGEDGRIHGNPDDPDGDNPETLAWFDVADLPGNPALRDVMQMNPWQTITNKPISTNPAAAKSLDRYAHIPEDQKRLYGRDAYPNDTVQVVELDYFGRPNVSLESGDRLIIERGISA